MHNDQQQPTDNQSANTASADKTQPVSQQQSRRALLRAAVAAPVIYTLPSGAALANTSTCESKADNFRPLTEDELQGVTDGTITEGSSLGDDFEYWPNNGTYSGDAIKASCWASLTAV